MKRLRENWTTILRVFVGLSAIAWASVSLMFNITDIIPNGVPPQLQALIAFWIFAAMAAIHIFSLYRQISSLHQQMRPQIKIVFGDFPSCRHGNLFRVGLLNSGNKTIENVHVSLEQLDPPGITFGPIRLIFMHQRQPEQQFDLHPGHVPLLFADVITDTGPTENAEVPEQRVFVLQYAVSGVPNTLTPGKYKLMLLAEGKDTQSVRESFLVSWDGKQMGFMMNNNQVK